VQILRKREEEGDTLKENQKPENQKPPARPEASEIDIMTEPYGSAGEWLPWLWYNFFFKKNTQKRKREEGGSTSEAVALLRTASVVLDSF